MAVGPQLSSLRTALAELTERVTEMANELEGSRRDDVAALLYDAERSLLAANRRLDRALDALGDG